MRLTTSSDEILCASEDECLHPRRRPSRRAGTEGAIFVVGVVAVQTFLTPPRYANTVARLLATKNDRVELLAFVVGAVIKRSVAELHYVLRGGKSCAPIVVDDGGFDDNRRSRTILVAASAAAHAWAGLREFRRQFGRRSNSDCLFSAPDAATIVPRGVVDRCAWLPLNRRNAPQHFP